MDKKIIADVGKYLTEHRQDIIDDIKALVSAKSPTTSKRDCNKCADLICSMAKERLGVEFSRHKHRNYGDTIYYVSPKQVDTRLFVLCHYDTVEDLSNPTPIRASSDDNRIGGAGILEAKFGIVSCLWAFKALVSLGLADNLAVNVVYNCDEEVGSPASSGIIKDIAKQSTHALVIAPTGNGRIITSCKGVTVYEINVKGVSAYAGDMSGVGRSAIFEAANIISTMEKLNDPEIGTTVNVNLISGGTRYNVIPENASLTVDVRYTDLMEGRRLDSIINSVLPHKNDIYINIKGRVNRPPVEKTAATDKMLQTLIRMASSIGITLEEAGISCVSGDICFTSAAGLPSLCGLGAVGGFAHSPSEYIETDESLKQTALLAGFFHGLSQN